MRRFEILWLHACGKFVPEVASLVQQNDDTVRSVIKNSKKTVSNSSRSWTPNVCHKLVEELAKELEITLQFLPGYSPNLNLIERLWKFVKKKCLCNVCYETFDEFTSGINDCLSRVETDYKAELEPLMKPNFQNPKKASLLAL